MSCVDFKTFIRVLDSVSRMTIIHCTATLYSIDFFTCSEVEKTPECFASIDCNCQFLLKDASKGDSYYVGKEK